jgi:uncharacterized membrane protein
MRTTKQLKAIARTQIAGNYSMLIMAMLLCSMLPSLLTSLFSNVLTLNGTRSYIIYYVVQVLIMLLGNMLTIGFIRMTMDLFRLKRAYGSTLFFAFRGQADRYLGAGLLMLLLTSGPLIPFYMLEQDLLNQMLTKTASAYSDSMTAVLCVLMVIGFVLSAFFSILFALVYPIMIDDPQLSILAAFGKSRKEMKGRKARLLYLYLSFLPLLFLGFLSLGIGLLWVYPLMQTTVTAFYMDTIHALDPKPAEED